MVVYGGKLHRLCIRDSSQGGDGREYTGKDKNRVPH